MSKLTDAFEELTQVCRIRPGQFEGDIAALARRVFKALGEYPEPIALTALDMWPRQSEWFPTEKELRDLLEEIQSEAEREAAARGQATDGTYHGPVGNTALFVEKVQAERGADYVKSWLAGGINCLFTTSTIYTTNIGVERLSKDCAALIKLCGVKIRHSPACSKSLAAYCEKHSLTYEPKRSRR